MDVAQIKRQLTTHFKENFERIRTLELAIKPTGGDNVPAKYVSYGTAGFRGRADQIGHLFYNVGLAAGLRCLSTGRDNLGVMITASHNPVEDNGVKIVDSDGNMLESRWEAIVEKFCNMPHSSVELAVELFEDLARLMDQAMELPPLIKLEELKPGSVMLAHDTRPSCAPLLELIKLGLNAWAPLISYKDYGQLTTPALHFLVGESSRQSPICLSVLEPEAYYEKLAKGMVKGVRHIHSAREQYKPYQLVVDCANGVGSLTMRHLCNHTELAKYFPVSLINYVDEQTEPGHGVLNYNCGADFVKTKHSAPQNANELNKRYASLDGDADRVVYFYFSLDGDKRRLHLLDGDKILALFAYHLKDILTQYKLNEVLTLGIVQTAYANGASTDYLTKELGLKVACVDTGVKHLHKKALDYDLGVYFEANGHGTIWVSQTAMQEIGARKVVELQRLLSVLNNYTGDAISDILIVELILAHYDWDIMKWDSLYEDRPNALTKVEIENRELVQTTNAGRTCLSPAKLQDKIDELVRHYGQSARSFVRASGTENVVRIYAECQSQGEADELAKKVGEVVVEMCNC